MENIIIIDEIGNLKYKESWFSGKVAIEINGEPAKKISKRQFEYTKDDKTYTLILKGNYYNGLLISIDGKEYQIIRKTKWYEYVISFIPFAFSMTFGNIQALFEIIPCIGGALGGAISLLFGVLGLMLNKSSKNNKTGILLQILLSFVGIVACIALAYLIIVLKQKNY